jgi:hypothetical protein
MREEERRGVAARPSKACFTRPARNDGMKLYLFDLEWKELSHSFNTSPTFQKLVLVTPGKMTHTYTHTHTHTLGRSAQTGGSCHPRGVLVVMVVMVAMAAMVMMVVKVVVVVMVIVSKSIIGRVMPRGHKGNGREKRKCTGKDRSKGKAKGKGKVRSKG